MSAFAVTGLAIALTARSLVIPPVHSLDLDLGTATTMILLGRGSSTIAGGLPAKTHNTVVPAQQTDARPKNET